MHTQIHVCVCVCARTCVCSNQVCVCVCVCVVIDTEKFGKVAYVSVGAHMVASIQFTMPESARGNKGDDYGYFQVSFALPIST